MLDSKTESLLKKLKALADRGVGGEKTNAQAMLTKLLQKHGLEEADLEGGRKDFHPVFVPKERYRLFFQVAGTVLGATIVIDKSDDEDILFVECTTAEAIEIEAKYLFYWNEFRGEIEILLDAYIRRNQLAIKGEDDSNATIDLNKLSSAERERIRRAMEMEEKVKRAEYQPRQAGAFKQIGK